MRKISILIIFVMLAAFAGCATVPEGQVPSPVLTIKQQNGMIRIISRDLACAVGRNNPKILDDAIAGCDTLLASDQDIDLQPALARLLKYLDLNVQDFPTLSKDLNDLLDMFDIPVLNGDIPLTDRQKEMIKIFAQAAKEGFEAAKANPK
jgi:hypothetical protein